MDKKRMVREIAKRTSLTQDEVESAYNQLFGTRNGWIEGILSDELAEGGKITISGFGTFTTVERAPMRRRVPGSGMVDVPARRTVRFKASAGLLTRA